MGEDLQCTSGQEQHTLMRDLMQEKEYINITAADIPSPEPSNVCLDFNKKKLRDDAALIFYPEAEDFVKVKGAKQQQSYAKVLESVHTRRKTHVLWFNEKAWSAGFTSR